MRLPREPAGARAPVASTPGPLQVQLDGLACTAVPPISRPEKLAPSMDSDEFGTVPPFDDGSRARFRADALLPATDALGAPLLANGNDAVGTVIALRPWPGVHARDGSAGLVEKSMSAPLRGGGTLSRIESSLAMRARPLSMADGALPQAGRAGRRKLRGTPHAPRHTRNPLPFARCPVCHSVVPSSEMYFT